MDRQINKELIEKQAKDILDKFATALEKVERENSEIESYVDREEFERVERASLESSDSKNSRFDSRGDNNGFKKRMLANSLNHDDDFIIGETGGWK